MFNIGDCIIYSSHGICQIDDIVENTYSGITKSYYVLHPLEDCNLKISTPVDNDKVVMLELLNKDKANDILQTFKLPGIDWIEIDNQRSQMYSEIVKSGNREEICKVVNTLMREKIKIEATTRKFHEKDRKILEYVQNILFAELAYSLNTTAEAISEEITRLITENKH